jgi:hypothetical protein
MSVLEGKADFPVAHPDFSVWHFSDMAFVLDDVRSWGAKRKLSALSEYFAF